MKQRLATHAVDCDHSYRPHELDIHLVDAVIQAHILTSAGGHKPVAQMLDIVIEVLGCPTPSTEALEIYYDLLIGYPEDIVNNAATILLARYKWPTMPKPADFIDAIVGQREYQMRVSTVHDLWFLQRAKNHYELERRAYAAKRALSVAGATKDAATINKVVKKARPLIEQLNVDHPAEGRFLLSSINTALKARTNN